MERDQRIAMFNLLESMTVTEKIELAAAARLLAEREAVFCRHCGVRQSMRHDAICGLGEVVMREDIVDVAEEIERRLIELRTGWEVPTDHELRAPQPITRKVRKLRPDLWDHQEEGRED